MARNLVASPSRKTRPVCFTIRVVIERRYERRLKRRFRRFNADARPDTRGNPARWNAVAAHQENSRLGRKVVIGYIAAIISRHRGIVCRNP
jgi:hypothetical protein